MPDETTVVLQEIANLLRRRVEQQDEMAKRSQENIARIEERKSEGISGVDRIREEGALRSAEMVAKMEKKNEQAKQERDKLQQEQRQFQERLVAELERHNSLLERLLSRLT